jgi:hypothetical protein
MEIRPLMLDPGKPSALIFLNIAFFYPESGIQYLSVSKTRNKPACQYLHLLNFNIINDLEHSGRILQDSERKVSLVRKDSFPWNENFFFLTTLGIPAGYWILNAGGLALDGKEIIPA